MQKAELQNEPAGEYSTVNHTVSPNLVKVSPSVGSAATAMLVMRQQKSASLHARSPVSLEKPDMLMGSMCKLQNLSFHCMEAVFG